MQRFRTAFPICSVGADALGGPAEHLNINADPGRRSSARKPAVGATFGRPRGTESRDDSISANSNTLQVCCRVFPWGRRDQCGSSGGGKPPPYGSLFVRSVIGGRPQVAPTANRERCECSEVRHGISPRPARAKSARKLISSSAWPPSARARRGSRGGVWLRSRRRSSR